MKAYMSYSADIGNEIGLEVRDVFPEAQDLLYYFIGAEKWLNLGQLWNVLKQSTVPESAWKRVVELLTWFSFLGVVRENGTDIQEVFIHHVHYDMKKLRRLANGFDDVRTEFCIHRAFWPFLDIHGQ